MEEVMKLERQRTNLERWKRIEASLFAAFMLFGAKGVSGGEGSKPWPADKAREWYDQQPWIIGCNFIPSTAINQLEMWQAETFDPDTIRTELGWAQSLGFNTARVYLHDLLWQQDAEGFLNRVDQYLEIADAAGIRTMFVLFDGVWDPNPALGEQPAPRPGVHNSGWVQNPHRDILKDASRHGELEPYVKGVLKRFHDDPRVLLWDLYNEPDNNNVLSYADDEIDNKEEMAFALLRETFKWAREVNPSQPLTVAVWHGVWPEGDRMTELDTYMLENSDVISFHNYAPLGYTEKRVGWLRRFDRPIICSEYLARAMGNTFEEILPYYKEQRIGAINWGLVAGKTQTIQPWGSWTNPVATEPDPWHHDIFREDGTPYRESEPELIRSLAAED